MPDQSSTGALRIGVPIPTAPSTDGGGFEFQQTVFAEILRRMAAGTTADFLRFVPISTSPDVERKWGLEPDQVVCLHVSLKRRLQCAIYRRIWRLLKIPPRPDLHSHLVAPESLSALRHKIDVLWSLEPGTPTDQIPFAITMWDLQHRLQPFFPEVSANVEWERRQALYDLIARKAFLCVAGTQRGGVELNQFFGVDQSRILVNPFPCPPTMPVAASDSADVLGRFSLEAGNYLLYPAQFWPHKNHVGALLAIRHLHDQGKFLKIVFTGADKGSLASLKRLAANVGIADAVVHAGFVDRRVLAALYSSSLALLFPSFFGPDNIPPLEAMSYGTPAVVADVPGAREQYGDAVLYFDPERPDQMAAAITRVADDRQLRDRLILSGRELISRLTPAAYVDKMLSAIESSAVALKCAGIASRELSGG